MSNWVQRGAKLRALSLLLSCWACCISCTSLNHETWEKPSLVRSESEDLGGLYLSWLWQLSDPQALEQKRLVISHLETTSLHVVLFDRLSGAQVLHLPSGSYRFHSLVDDRFHPLALNHILPHKFHIVAGKISIIGSLEFLEGTSQQDVIIRQSAYFSHSELASIADQKLISAYNQQPLPYQLISPYSLADCQGIHCPNTQFHRCFINEFSQGPIQYGQITINLTWSGKSYLIEVETQKTGSSYSKELFNCLNERVDSISEAIFGKQITIRI